MEFLHINNKDMRVAAFISTAWLLLFARATGLQNPEYSATSPAGNLRPAALHHNNRRLLDTSPTSTNASCQQCSACMAQHRAGGCGSMGQWCCCQATQASPKYYGCCPQAGTYCQFFSFQEPGPEGTCPAPSLCLPLPSTCGGLNKACCPPVSTIGDDFTCNGANLKCVRAPVNTTIEAYLALSSNPYNSLLLNYGQCVQNRR